MGTSASSRPRPRTTRWSAVSSISLIRWLETSTVRPSSASAAQQFAHPADALGVQSVDRLVEQQDVGVAEQRGRDAEPLVHAQREAAHPLVGDGLQADQLDHLVHPRARAARCSAPGRAGGGRRCGPGAGRRGSISAPTRRIGWASSRYGRPSTVAVPEVGRVRPRMQRIVVVLPEPLGPRKPVTRPGSTVTVRSSTATRAPYRFVRPADLDHAVSMASADLPRSEGAPSARRRRQRLIRPSRRRPRPPAPAR